MKSRVMILAHLCLIAADSVPALRTSKQFKSHVSYHLRNSSTFECKLCHPPGALPVVPYTPLTLVCRREMSCAAVRCETQVQTAFHNAHSTQITASRTHGKTSAIDDTSLPAYATQQKHPGQASFLNPPESPPDCPETRKPSLNPAINK